MAEEKEEDTTALKNELQEWEGIYEAATSD